MTDESALTESCQARIHLLTIRFDHEEHVPAGIDGRIVQIHGDPDSGATV